MTAVSSLSHHSGLCLPAGAAAAAMASPSSLAKEPIGESLLLLLPPPPSCPGAAPPAFRPGLPLPPRLPCCFPAPTAATTDSPQLAPSFPFPRLPRRPLPLFPATAKPRDSPPPPRLPDGASPRKSSPSPAPGSEQVPAGYRFTAQELHAVLYGAVPSGTQRRVLSRGPGKAPPGASEHVQIVLPTSRIGEGTSAAG